MNIKTTEQADAVNALIDEAMGTMPPLGPGDHAKLPPCLPESHLAVWRSKYGQPCPRPGRAPEPANAVAWQMVMASITEHTRHLALQMMAAGYPEDEHTDVLERVFGCLVSEPVIEVMTPKPLDGNDG